MRKRILLEPRPQYATVLDGTSQYWSKTTPVNMDLNGSEMVTAQTDRDFETNVGNWTGAGTHSIAQSALQAHAGTKSGLITAAGIGDATTNYVTLAAANFTTIVSGNKYTLEIWARSIIAGTKVTVKIGDATAQSVALSTTAWTKFVYNFQATSSTVAQDLLLYLSAIDGVYIDDVSLSRAWDAMWAVKLKTSYSAAAQSVFTRAVSLSNGYFIRLNATTTFWDVRVSDNSGNNTINNFASNNVTDGRSHVVAFTFDHTNAGSLLAYLDGTSVGIGSIINQNQVGKIVPTSNFEIGIRDASVNFFNGIVGEFQFIRFTSLPSDIATTIANISANKNKSFPNSYTNGTIVGWWDWSTRSGLDKSGQGNHLTGTAIPPIVKTSY